MSEVPKGLKPWAKGQSGNPGGAPKLPAELREARRKNMASLIRLIHLYVGLTHEQAAERLAGPEALQLEQMIQGQISKASEGDARSFQFLIEIMCGKIPESDESPNASDTLTPEQKLEAAKKMVQILEKEIHGPRPIE